MDIPTLPPPRRTAAHAPPHQNVSITTPYATSHSHLHQQTSPHHSLFLPYSKSLTASWRWRRWHGGGAAHVAAQREGGGGGRRMKNEKDSSKFVFREKRKYTNRKSNKTSYE
ncbi:hypothetical protein E2C01_063032 [Portunus trituberculatus]|uniref:Uncharacterized protein n=1 Tax=Portunus trituberculatus TaxID=210409 RepID=A0A5B7HCM8_PORTR|nr:hypothetical protein [Portunus trituberculatus]